MQNNLDELKHILPKNGFPTRVEGAIDVGIFSTKFAYFDTRDSLGIWLEIAQHRVLGKPAPPIRVFIARLALMQRLLKPKLIH
jgi:hypothetical protein